MEPDLPPPSAGGSLDVKMKFARFGVIGGYGCSGFGILFIVITLIGIFSNPDDGGNEGLAVGLGFLVAGGLLRHFSRKAILKDIGFEALVGIIFMGAGGVMVIGGIILAFDDPGGLFLIPFGGIFMGMGYVAYRVMRAPEGKKRITVAEQSHTFTGVDGTKGVQTSSVQILVDADATEEEAQAARTQWGHEKWLRRPDWAEGRIQEERLRDGSAAYWAAGCWSVFSGGLLLVWAIWSEPPLFFALIPSFVAVLLVYYAVRTYLHRRKFGPSHLVLETTPAYLGSRLVGSVETGVESRHAPPDGFTIHLACVDRYERKTSDNKTEVGENVLWEVEEQHNGRPYQSLPRRLAVPIDVTLPADRPATSLHSERLGIVWRLTITAAVPGVDYSAEFRLPVFDRDRDPSRPEGGSSTDDGAEDEDGWTA